MGEPGPGPRSLSPGSGPVHVPEIQHQPQVGPRQVQWGGRGDRRRREWDREQRGEGQFTAHNRVGATLMEPLPGGEKRWEDGW